MSSRYILEGHNLVPCEDLMEWADWFEKTERHVANEVVDGGPQVSTVFLGMDHGGIFNQGPPILFETMVFGGPLDQEQDRYATWEEAEAGHKAMVARVRAAQSTATRAV